MKRFNMLVLGVLCAVAMGCSNKDNKNSSKAGPAAATPEGTVARLSIDDDSKMTFTLSTGDTIELTLTGEARSDDMRRNALSNEDNSVKADVMTVSGQKHVFVAVKNRDDVSLSSLYLFTSANGTYNLRINNVAIARANALDLILQALGTHVDNGMNIDEAVDHMANAFSGNSGLTFSTYLESLTANGEVIADPDFPEEEPPVEQPPAEQRPPVESSDGEPRPVYLGPYITDHVTGYSRPRPRPTHPTRPAPPKADLGEAGRTIVVKCYERQSELVVNDNRMELPRMRGCVDRRGNPEDKFIASVRLGHALDYIDSINDIKLQIEVDFSKQHFVEKAYFKLKPVIWPNNGADWYPKWYERGGQQLIYRGDYDVEFTREAWMDAPFRDSFNIQVTCKVQQNNRGCGH